MPYAGEDFPAQSPNESLPLTFKFGEQLVSGETISSADWDIEVVQGEDDDVATRLVGTPSNLGADTTHRVTGLQSGVSYRLTATVVTSQGNTFELYANVAGVDPDALLVVEDGTGEAASESYVGISEFRSYCSKSGHSITGKSDTEIAQALRRATRYIDGKYRYRFLGIRTNGREQALEWPRMDAVDIEGETIADDEIPFELINAVAEAALRELTSPGSLTPDQVETQQVKREKVGSLEIEYADNAGRDTQRPLVPVIDEILAPILISRSSSIGFLQRA